MCSWINVKDRLPENNEYVLALPTPDGWMNEASPEIVYARVVIFVRGRTFEERKESRLHHLLLPTKADEWGENRKPYCWRQCGLIYDLTHRSQDVDYWMPLPHLPKIGEE